MFAVDVFLAWEWGAVSSSNLSPNTSIPKENCSVAFGRKTNSAGKGKGNRKLTFFRFLRDL